MSDGDGWGQSALHGIKNAVDGAAVTASVLTGIAGTTPSPAETGSGHSETAIVEQAEQQAQDWFGLKAEQEAENLGAQFEPGVGGPPQ